MTERFKIEEFTAEILSPAFAGSNLVVTRLPSAEALGYVHTSAVADDGHLCEQETSIAL